MLYSIFEKRHCGCLGKSLPWRWCLQCSRAAASRAGTTCHISSVRCYPARWPHSCLGRCQLRGRQLPHSRRADGNVIKNQLYHLGVAFFNLRCSCQNEIDWLCSFQKGQCDWLRASVTWHHVMSQCHFHSGSGSHSPPKVNFVLIVWRRVGSLKHSHSTETSSVTQKKRYFQILKSLNLGLQLYNKMTNFMIFLCHRFLKHSDCPSCVARSNEGSISSFLVWRLTWPWKCPWPKLSQLSSPLWRKNTGCMLDRTTWKWSKSRASSLHPLWPASISSAYWSRYKFWLLLPGATLNMKEKTAHSCMSRCWMWIPAMEGSIFAAASRRASARTSWILRLDASRPSWRIWMLPCPSSTVAWKMMRAVRFLRMAILHGCFPNAWPSWKTTEICWKAFWRFQHVWSLTWHWQKICLANSCLISKCGICTEDKTGQKDLFAVSCEFWYCYCQVSVVTEGLHCRSWQACLHF